VVLEHLDIPATRTWSLANITGNILTDQRPLPLTTLINYSDIHRHTQSTQLIVFGHDQLVTAASLSSFFGARVTYIETDRTAFRKQRVISSNIEMLNFYSLGDLKETKVIRNTQTAIYVLGNVHSLVRSPLFHNFLYQCEAYGAELVILDYFANTRLMHPRDFGMATSILKYSELGSLENVKTFFKQRGLFLTNERDETRELIRMMMYSFPKLELLRKQSNSPERSKLATNPKLHAAALFALKRSMDEENLRLIRLCFTLDVADEGATERHLS